MLENSYLVGWDDGYFECENWIAKSLGIEDTDDFVKEVKYIYNKLKRRRG
jgi:hypothetical protein